MKSSGTNLILLLLLVLALFFVLYARHDRTDAGDWKRRAHQYEQSSDSLRQTVNDLRQRVASKDSLLLQYMMSVDKTLAELNKEARKNASIILENDITQDSLIRSYCNDMKAAGYAPDACQ